MGSAFALLVGTGFVAACNGSAGASAGDAAADRAVPSRDGGRDARDARPDATEAGRDAVSGTDAGDGPSLPTKSLRTDFLAACDGVTDDRDAVAKAFAAAAGNAFELQIDATCSAYIKVGTDITKPIFFDTGTTVRVLKGGKFILDNVSIPTFEVADTNDVTLIDWDVEYIGSLPVANTTWVGGSYNDKTLKTFLATQRGITWDSSAGWVSAHWASPTNMCSIFDIRGSTSAFNVTGMTLTGGTTGDKFIPMVFSMTAEVTASQVISAKTPFTSAAFAIPSNMTFTDVTIDGAYFGWQGQPASSSFTNITSLRYGDLQDAKGGSVGGASCPGNGGGCEFAPPHLFYINEGGTDPALMPHDNHITHVMDKGVRVGVARNPGSGNACSIKLGGNNSTLNDYTSYRPDGLMDVLESSGNTIQNVTATFDSTFCGDKYPIIRFPGTPYTNLTMLSLSLADTAASTDHAIFPGSSYPGSVTNGSLGKIDVTMNHWSGTGDYVAAFAGSTSDTLVDYTATADHQVKSAGQKNSVGFELAAEPATVVAGSSTTLTWSSTGATSCSASGGWSGALAIKGTQSVALTTPGNHVLTLTCTNGTDSGVASVTLKATP